ncbi:hypothetical protein, partial [Prevotella intermedia]|uniref:hypothetical protein n=1 Tax=Prevotella intermedia TaxID=28131 RepID=UPI0005EBA67A
MLEGHMKMTKNIIEVGKLLQLIMRSDRKGITRGKVVSFHKKNKCYKYFRRNPFYTGEQSVHSEVSNFATSSV